MRAIVIESVEFTQWVSESLPDETYSQLQLELMRAPEKGAVMPGCGGLRKIRIADPRRGKGKRGGARVIYLYLPNVRWFFMLDGYGKDEQADLSAAEKKALCKHVDQLHRQAQEAFRRGKTKGIRP